MPGDATPSGVNLDAVSSRYNGIMFTYDPKSTKVSKGFESPNLQGRVNSLGSSILVDTSPWTNVDPVLPSSKLFTILSNISWLVWEMFASMEHVLMVLIEKEGYDEHWGSIIRDKNEQTKLEKFVNLRIEVFVQLTLGLLRLKVLMVDSITFGQDMVNILVSGEAYDKVFNHLDMLHAPLEGKVMIITTAKSLLLLLVKFLLLKFIILIMRHGGQETPGDLTTGDCLSHKVKLFLIPFRGRSLKRFFTQAQLNNLGREIKKVNEKVYAAQVGCEQCKGPHYTKDCPLKEEGKTIEEAYYTQFGAPFQGGGYRATALGFYQRNMESCSKNEGNHMEITWS
ncbi:hypothetical protein Tco_0503668 [Tanacetum coccineum]